MCARGYSNRIAGISTSSMMIAMILSAVPVGMIASRIKRELQCTKIFYAALIIPSFAISYLVTVPGHTALLLTLSVLLGVTGR